MVLQQLLSSQFLCSQHKFCFPGNYTEVQIHPIFTIRLHFTQKVVGELPFLLHENCLHIKEHFLRKFKKILSRGFGATLILQNIKVAPKPLDRIFLNFLKKCSLMCKQFSSNKKRKFTDYFLCKMQLNTRNRVYLRACQVAMTTKVSVRVQELISLKVIATSAINK